MDSILKTLDNSLSVLKTNTYVSSIVVLVITLYAALAAPSLPAWLAKLFESTTFKLAFMVVLLLVNNYSPRVAILVAVAFMVSMQTLSKYRIYTMANELSDIVGTPVKFLKGTRDLVKDVVTEVASVASSLSGSDSDSESNENFNGEEAETVTQELSGYSGPDLATIGLPESTI